MGVRSSIRWSGARLCDDKVGAGEALCVAVVLSLGLKSLDRLTDLGRIVPTGS